MDKWINNNPLVLEKTKKKKLEWEIIDVNKIR